MTLPDFTMRQLLEAGVHFGHQTKRWNPKMAPYIFGARNGIHIIDLSQTMPLLHQAIHKLRDIVMGGGRIIFVGTKRQAQNSIKSSALRCAQYYMNVRWLGGTLTNWDTISNSINRLKKTEEILEKDTNLFTKKEILELTRERTRLEAYLGGIRDMGGKPDAMIVVDIKKEAIAVKEAQKLNIPVFAIIDTNCDPDGIAYPIPGNDDSSKSIELYCELFADAIIDGLAQSNLYEANEKPSPSKAPSQKDAKLATKPAKETQDNKKDKPVETSSSKEKSSEVSDEEKDKPVETSDENASPEKK